VALPASSTVQITLRASGRASERARRRVHDNDAGRSLVTVLYPVLQQVIDVDDVGHASFRSEKEDIAFFGHVIRRASGKARRGLLPTHPSFIGTEILQLDQRPDL